MRQSRLKIRKILTLLLGSTTALTSATFAADHLRVGENGPESITITGSQSNETITIGYPAGSGAVTISGSAANLAVTSGGTMGDAGTGSLTIENGGTFNAIIGSLYMGTSGSINVTGTGSSLRVGTLHSGTPADYDHSDGWLYTWGGAVSVSSGATLEADGVYIGGHDSAPATLSVSGVGTTMDAHLALFVGGDGNPPNGEFGNGTLTVSAGASAWASMIVVGNDSASTGKVLVTGAGSSLSSTSAFGGFSGNFYVGNGGSGTVVVQDGASISATNRVRIAADIGSAGRLIIGGEAEVAAPGSVSATNGIAFGSGAGQLVFNHTGSNYVLAPEITGTGQIFADAGVTTINGDATGFHGAVSIAAGATLGFENGVGGNTTFDVRGTLSGASGSVDLAGGGNVFNVYNSARFIGGVNFNSTGSNTINFYTGSYTMPVLNYALSDPTNAINLLGTAHTLITSDLDGQGTGNIVLVDTSSVAAVDRAASDVQRQVSGVLQDIMNLDVARPGPTLAPSAYASSDARPNPTNLALKETKDQAIAIDDAGNLAWMRAFMGARHQDGSDGLASTNGRQFGTLVGADHLFDDWRLGVYAGAGRSTTSLAGNLGSLDSDMALAGLYARRGIGALSLDMALTGGHIWADSERGVNNGTETARGSFNGWFIAPEAALSVDYALNPSWKLTPSLRGRYVASFYDAFNESGSSQNISYDSHVSHSLEERFDTRLTYATVTRAGLSASAWLGAGVSATQRVGNGAYDASVSGVDFAIVATGDRNVYGATAAAGFDVMISRSASLFGSLETTFASDDSRTGLVRGGVKIAF